MMKRWARMPSDREFFCALMAVSNDVVGECAAPASASVSSSSSAPGTVRSRGALSASACAEVASVQRARPRRDRGQGKCVGKCVSDRVGMEAWAAATDVAAHAVAGRGRSAVKAAAMRGRRRSGAGANLTLSFASVLLIPSSPSHVYRFLALRTTTSTPSSTLTISYIRLRSTPAAIEKENVNGERDRGRERRKGVLKILVVCFCGLSGSVVVGREEQRGWDVPSFPATASRQISSSILSAYSCKKLAAEAQAKTHRSKHSAKELVT